MRKKLHRVYGSWICGPSTAWVLLVVLAAGCEPAYQWNGQVVDPIQAAPPLAGTNWNGDAFQLSDVKGKVAIVFFGYTFCPDICPFTLVKMKQLFSRLDERAEDVAVVFVSVDPHRDSLEKLASYVPNFDERFYGLRLETDELETIQEAWELTVQYGQPRDGPGTDSFYYVDHTGFYFIVDREGQLRLTFPPTVTVDDITPDVETLLGKTEHGGQLEVTGLRAQVMPNGMGAVYLSVRNPGSRNERLVSVESAAASAIETHESVDDDGVMRMVPRPEGFEIPAGATLVLEPGGKHIMLIGSQLEEGATTIPLTLHFEHAGPVEIEAALMQMGGMDHSGAAHEDMQHKDMEH